MARVYDVWLGGKDNLAVDREVAARIAQAAPVVVTGVRANRAFVRRAVAFLAEAGLDQFLDLGSGLPTGENVHEVTGRINPAAKVAYVDVDPIVLVHARALLADPTRTIVIEGDVGDPAGILANPELRGFIDFRRPVAVVAAAILHFVSDAEDPARIVAGVGVLDHGHAHDHAHDLGLSAQVIDLVPTTHNGGPAVRTGPDQDLRLRSSGGAASRVP